jgi:MFS family permease
MQVLSLPEIKSLALLNRDGKLLFASRSIRLFAYGLISLVLGLYLKELKFDEGAIGLLISLTLVGDTVVSLWLSTQSDRFGRRRLLIVGAILMILAGIVFGLSSNYVILTIAAIIGVISPSGNEVGSFLAIEQAGLSQIISDKSRTQIFAWYNLFGSVATAIGALVSGGIVQILQNAGVAPVASYQLIMMLYAALGFVLVFLFSQVSNSIELQTVPTNLNRFGLQHSQKVVFGLSLLFALDAFGGGFVVQAIMAYWFDLRFGVEPAIIGLIFFWANILAALSALAAARIAERIGLINTMVFTHIPSNILLILVPLMPNLPLAILVLLARFSISQMDVPTRQSYVMAVVDPEERSAAAGITGIARTVGAAISPLLTGFMLGAGFVTLPFFVAGGLKIVYDLALYQSFRSMKPKESLE